MKNPPNFKHTETCQTRQVYKKCFSGYHSSVCIKANSVSIRRRESVKGYCYCLDIAETRLTDQNVTLILVLMEICEFQVKTLLLVLSTNTSVTK